MENNELLNTVKNQLNSGFTKEMIYSNLLSSGHTTEDINNAFDNLENIKAEEIKEKVGNEIVAPEFDSRIVKTVMIIEAIIILLNIIYIAGTPRNTPGMDGLAFLIVPLYSSFLIVALDVITFIYSLVKIIQFKKRHILIPKFLNYSILFSLKILILQPLWFVMIIVKMFI